ncbi:MAG TPA: response regulator transcription factor [Verrucomicrobiae bacterium]|nr:response regulator transcription factor [Verrucomicrobiae bacterium]
MKILVVEDDLLLRDGLVDLLKGAGHTVDMVSDGLAATKRGMDPELDLVLLDVMLPKLDGIEVCHRLRKARPDLPILMLTAKGAEEDKVRGLKTGADDYVTKPFGARELLARIAALGRRAKSAPAEPEIIAIDGCRIDLGHCEARRDGRIISLTAREVGILRWLHRHKARAISRSELLEQVWGADAKMETRTVDVTIANLRHKIERDHSDPKIVSSVKGIGYAWGRR